MEITVVWTHRAEAALSETIHYLEKEWSATEIRKLKNNIQSFIERIKLFPDSYPKSEKYPYLRKGLVDKNNYIVYWSSHSKRQITIINFRSFHQKRLFD